MFKQIALSDRAYIYDESLAFLYCYRIDSISPHPYFEALQR